MPSYITHTWFGRCVQERLNSDISSLLNTYPVAYQWGTQGPDVLFFRNGFKKAPNPLGEFGALMHKTKTPQLFGEIGRYLSDLAGTPEFGPAASYSYGFICHYCTDKNTHPYVYFLQEQIKGQYSSSLPYGVHMKLETDLDSALYKQVTGQNIRHYKLSPALLQPGPETEVVCRFHTHMIKQLFGEEYPPTSIRLCMENFFQKEKLMFDPTFVRSYVFCRSLEIIRGEKNTYTANCRRHKIAYDILNLKKRPWFNYQEPEIQRSDSVLEILDMAVSEAVALIEEMHTCVASGNDFTRQHMPSFDFGNPVA